MTVVGSDATHRSSGSGAQGSPRHWGLEVVGGGAWVVLLNMHIGQPRHSIPFCYRQE